MGQERKTPPRWLTRLLLSFLKRELAEEVIGDLEEKYNQTVKDKNVRRANLNYGYQVFNYIRPFAIRISSINISGMYMYQSYFKIGWRNLQRNKGYASINIVGLGLAMAVAMFIAMWINDELAFNKNHDNYSTIGKVLRYETWDGGIRTNSSHVTGLGTLLRTEYGAAFKHVVMANANPENRVLSANQKKFSENGYFMQPEGGEMLSLKMKYGTRDGLKDMNSILLSKSVSERLFGDKDPVNETVSMDNVWDLKVTGVYEDLPKNSEFAEVGYFAPLDRYLNGWATLDAWDNYHICIYVQLNPGYDFDEVSASIKNSMLPHVRKEVADTNPRVFLQPMSKLHLYSSFENGVPVTSERLRFVWFNAIIGLFVLVLACINFMNLSTARSEKRSKEVGIRKSIGSVRTQLIQQFIGESVLIAMIAFLFALVILRLSLPWFNNVADKSMSIPWTSPIFWFTCIAFTFVTGILAGSYPAFFLSSVNTVRALKGNFKAGTSARLPRRLLVVFQFTVSISIVIGTVVVYDQIEFVKNRPVGYSRQALLQLSPKSPEYRGKYDVLRAEMKRTGVVSEIAEANYSALSTLGWNSGFYWTGMPSLDGPSFNTIQVTYDYGKTIGMEFIQGRDFSRELGDHSVIILNESAAKLTGLNNPVGEMIHWYPDGKEKGTYKVVGVVKDMVKGSPFEPTDPSIIFLKETDLQWLYIKIDPAVSPGQALPKIQSVFNSIIPSAPFEYTFMDEAYDAKFRAEERVGKLSGIFSVLTILISCSGLFGLSSFMAEQKTKEMSIRKVLGASVIQLWKLMSSEFVVLVIIACVIAVPITYNVMARWIDQYNYKTTIGIATFGYAIMGALLLTMITVSFQAIKTALRNPVDSLKSE